MPPLTARRELAERTAATQPAATPHVARADGAEILAAARRPDVTLALWRRTLAAPISRFARTILLPWDLRIGFEAEAGDVAEALTAAVGGLGDGQDAAAWIQDVRHLARLFAWATGARRLHIRLETLRHDACRFFHVDNVRCRLITTYVGPGTQWLHDADVVRGALERGDNEAVRRAGARIQSLRAGWIGLFKGERLPALRGRGIVHRSAPIRGTGRHRLVLKIDYAGEIAG